MATRSPQRQRGEGLDGGDVLTPSGDVLTPSGDGMTARCQNIPAIQALPLLALGGAGGHALTYKFNADSLKTGDAYIHQ
jgi:hypothetical protein